MRSFTSDASCCAYYKTVRAVLVIFLLLPPLRAGTSGHIAPELSWRYTGQIAKDTRKMILTNKAEAEADIANRRLAISKSSLARSTFRPST